MSDVRVGCSGWNYPHWRERVYPKGLPPKRWLEYYARLASAFEVLPPGRHCFEFREPSWYAEDVYSLLRRHGVALVIPDSPKYPFRTLEVTTDWTFVRFPRLARAKRELLPAGDRGVGRAHPRLAERRPRRLRVLQQRLGGPRRQERPAAQGAPRSFAATVLLVCSSRPLSRSPKRSAGSSTPS